MSELKMSELKMRDLRVSILVPVYNSERTIGRLVDTIVEVLSRSVNLHEIILVNDGSADKSHEVILEAIQRHPDRVKYLRLFRNFGEHNAVMAGLNYFTGDAVAIIDDDFQNPPAEIVRLCEELSHGYDVVYSYYEQKKHSVFRNLGSKFNDWVATILLSKPRKLYLSSFKVMSAPLVKIIIQYNGPFPYIDGIILRSTTNIGKALVQHSEREEGKSNYTLTKLVRLWLNMFTGFSIIPLRLSSYLGFMLFIGSIFLTTFFVLVRLFGPVFIRDQIPAGWASTIVVITLFFGVQFMMMGMIGEYLGRLFLTNHGMPQFLIRDIYGLDSDVVKDKSNAL
jgi:glycosyltransferase involved in cell wall biosynthesis